MTTTQPTPTNEVVPEQASLYERLGGREPITIFAAEVVARCMKDDVIGHYWDHMSEDRTMEEIMNFVDWLSDHWGGMARYHGRNLATVHRGMGVTEEHWDALFRVIDGCYDDFNLAPELRVEVDTFLRKFKPVIVSGPSFRDVVMANPDVFILEGMKGMGVKPGPEDTSTRGH